VRVQEYVYNRLQFRYMGQPMLLLQTGKAYGLLPVGLWEFDGIFVFDTIRVYIVYPVHEPLYLGKIALVSIRLRMVLTNSGIQRFSHLDISTKYQYLTGNINLIPPGRFLDTIFDVDY